MRQSNVDYTRLRALKLIRRSAGISRSELALAMGLTKAALTHVVADLLERGFVVEKKLEAGRRGRPNFGLSVVAAAAHALCVQVWTDGRARFEIVDMEGRALHGSAAQLRMLKHPEAFATELTEAIGKRLAAPDFHSVEVRHLAVVLPARVDRRTGVVHWLTPGENHVPVHLGERLQAAFGVPATVDNRTTILARGENWFAADAENFSYIGLVGRGIGAARYVDGMLQIGANGMGGELAHTKLAIEGGRACHCGGSGCVIAYASVMAIARVFASTFGNEAVTASEIDFWYDRAVACAQSNDEQALAIFAAAGRALGTAVASHVNALDPGRVIVGIDRAELVGLLEPGFRTALSTGVLPELLAATTVELRPIVFEHYRQGATALALEHLYLAAPSGPSGKPGVQSHVRRNEDLV